MFSVKITGSKELDKKLKALPDKLSKKVIRSAMRKASKPLVTIARANAPERTGQLKENIKIRTAKRSRKNKSRIVLRVGASAKDYVGKQFYSAFQEFGSSRNPPSAFLRRAYDLGGKAARDTALKEIAKGLEKLVKGAA